MRGVILYSSVLAKPFSARVQMEIVSMHFIRITNGHMVFFFFFFFFLTKPAFQKSIEKKLHRNDRGGIYGKMFSSAQLFEDRLALTRG